MYSTVTALHLFQHSSSFLIPQESCDYIDLFLNSDNKFLHGLKFFSSTKSEAKKWKLDGVNLHYLVGHPT